MNLYRPREKDFDLDPDFGNDYHQDFREGPAPSIFQSGGATVTLLFCLLPIVYQILFLLDYNLLPLPELLWNCLVYVTPSRLLDVLETYKSPLQISKPASAGIPRTHASKSEAMRRILGLDTPGGIIGTVAQAGRRRLSTLQGINMGGQRQDGRPAGLGNWDNSCYQNSVLQGLASLDSLTEYLTSPKIVTESSEEEDQPDMKMAEALKDLITTLNDPENNGRRIWTPATLKNMSSWQQQDAQEYFSKVLDEIDKEVGKIAKSARVSRGIEFDRDLSQMNMTESPPVSIYRNPLEGLIAQRVGCTKCGYSEGLSMIPFNCLTVPLGRAWEHHISECLDEYTKLEQIEGVECGKCTLLKTQRLLSMVVDRTKDSPDDNRAHEASKARVEIVNTALEEDDYEDKTLLQKCNIPPKSRVTSTKSRQAVIARPPKSLVVHFNRSLFDEMSGELSKNYSEVRFPKILDLGSWCLGSSGSKEDTSIEEWLLNPDKPMVASSRQHSRLRGPLYEIRGVVTHYGRHENGHYVCYKKHPVPDFDDKRGGKKDQWWRLSDDDVIEVTEANVLGQGGVFMLFYDCIGPARLEDLKSSEVEVAAPIPTAESEDTVNSSTPETNDEYLSDDAKLPVTIPDSSTDVELAANIPLPDFEDDLSESEYEDSLLTTREESVATSVSEFDDDDENVDSTLDSDYTPAQAILVPQYIQQSNQHSDGEVAGKPAITASGSLVMV